MDMKQWMNYTGKPSLFEQGTAPFWNDEHISLGMLEAHLNPQLEAASRTRETIEQSVEWLHTDIAAPARCKRILDLGCGPGLYTSRLSRLGYATTGIDLSPRSIAYAREEAERSGDTTEYICGNYLTADFPPGSFDLIMIVYCDFPVLSTPDRDLLLRNIRRWLSDDGLFVFDVFTPQHYAGQGDKESTSWYASPGGFWRAGAHLCLEAHYVYPEDGVYLNQAIVMDDKGELDVYNIWDRVYTRDSAAELLVQNGFEPVGWYSDVAGKPWAEDSGLMCAVARKNAIEGK